MPLAGDASSRRYVRLRLEGPAAPPTAVVMVLPAPASPDHEEIDFIHVHRRLTALGIAVPALYHADPGGSGTLLLEDVGDRALADVLADSETAPAEADRLLDEVAEILATLATSPSTPDCRAYARAHDESLIRRELRSFLTDGLAGAGGDDRRDPALEAELARLGSALAAQPRRLMHRDFHAWNLHVDARGRIRVLDFQDAMLGPPTYDLASFCTDRDSDRFIDEPRERALLSRYADALDRRGSDLYRSRVRLERDYFTSVAFRTLRVIGRFRVLARQRGDSRYLRFIPRMARQTRRALDALGNTSLARCLAARSEDFA